MARPFAKTWALGVASKAAFAQSFALKAALACCALALCFCVLIPQKVAVAEAADAENQEIVDVTITQLTEVDTDLDGAMVRVSGEAIGEKIRSETADYWWINIADDSNTIGVFVTAQQAELVENYGAFGMVGSTVEVVGTYHMACNEGHAGTLDVHASQLAVVEPGGAQPAGYGSSQGWIVACALVVVAGILVFIRKYRER